MTSRLSETVRVNFQFDEEMTADQIEEMFLLLPPFKMIFDFKSCRITLLPTESGRFPLNHVTNIIDGLENFSDYESLLPSSTSRYYQCRFQLGLPDDALEEAHFILTRC